MDFHHLKLQSTPDNSNLLWKPKKVRVIVSSEQITGNKQMAGVNASVMHTSLQRQQEIKIDIVNKELSNNA